MRALTLLVAIGYNFKVFYIFCFNFAGEAGMASTVLEEEEEDVN